MIECIETRLVLDEKIMDAPFVLYLARTPEHAVAEAYVRQSAFESEPPKEIIITIKPA